ncbi:hypothetical protein DFH28DRAFT_273391 [Melampsora americana]|nr:hypothetical protein DFH28DRAFT_273391 [Melampsora americana]
MYQIEQIITLIFLISILIFTFLNINPSSIFLPFILIFNQLTSILKFFGIIVFIIFIFISIIALWELVLKRFIKNTSLANHNYQSINLIVIILSILFLSSFIISSFKASKTKTNQTSSEEQSKILLKSYSSESNSFQLFIAIFSLFLILILSSSMKEDFKNWKKERKLKKLSNRSKLTNHQHQP